VILAASAVATLAPHALAAPRRPKTETLFISPAGQPFRADPGQPYPVAAWFAQADADHDGKLTREEFRADFANFFRQLDTDHNGFIDGVEIAVYEQDVAPEVLPHIAQTEAGDFPADPTDAGKGGSGRRATRRLAQAPARKGELAIDGAPEFSFLNISEPVSNADQNFDGKISLAEFLAAADRRFDLLDEDHNGYLTLDTLPQTPDQIAVEGKRKTR
jgi:hypothetical protein